MPCPQCGTEAPAGAKFCSECATPLAQPCPGCGHTNPATAKFCSECATPLGGGPARVATAPAPASVAERRLVSVLFADLVGFTPFAEERDAEEVRETLSRYFDIARDTIERYGGTVEKFIGDAVMAVWGTPSAREDDAERAVRAALELTDEVRVLGQTIQARAGVLTGEAAVTLGATDQGMVAGDIVNTAARLQSVAEPGSVLVGESTMRAASAAIAFEEAGDATLKGKASPVPAYRALRVVAERGGRNRAGGLEPPFVGRDEELRLLKEMFHASSREQRTRLVSVIGPAGIGKSRLAWEFSKYTDGLAEEIWWHNGRSPAYGDGITFWALGEMIRGRAGLVETDDEDTTRAKVAEMVTEHIADDTERQWIEPAMLTLLGIGDGAIGSEQLFAAWRTFFERMAASGTVTLVFEDLHWADTGLLDFIDHLLDWTRDLPIYIVTLARPELLERRPNWGAGKRHFTSLFLEPLPDAAMRELLTGLVPSMPEAAIRAIVARADGVPLYAVETVRMLIAEGRLTEADGVCTPAGDLSALAVPDSLTSLIAARLDALDPADRSLLQDASVLGQTFTTSALAAVSGGDAAELEPRLRGLVRRELLVLKSDPRSPDRGQYAFVQSLIREVGYNTLARRDRKARHLAAARHFEAMPTDELAGALAGHYLAAHANAAEGPEADALATQARIALRAAADRAVSLGAPEQAFGFLSQAIGVADNDADVVELTESAGEAAAASGRHEEAVRLFGRARELRTAAGDRSAAAGAAAAVGRTLLDAYRSDEAVTMLEAAAAEFADLRGEPPFAGLEGQLARAYFFRDQGERAIEVSDRVLDVAEHGNLVEIIADTLITKGSSLGSVGRMREGLMLVRGGGELAEESGLPHIALRSYINRVFGEQYSDPGASLDATRTGLALARRLGLRSLATVLVGNAAAMAQRTGEWAWGEAQLREALEDDLDPAHRALILTTVAYFAEARGSDSSEIVAELENLIAESEDPQSRLQLADLRAWREFVRGRYSAASEHWRQATSGQTIGAGESWAMVGRAAVWAGDPAVAGEALAALDEAGAFGRAIDATRAGIRAGIAAIEGRSSEALALYREVLRTWRDLKLPFDEALTGLEMAMLLDSRLPDVQAAAGVSRRILAELGAEPFVRALDAAIADGTATSQGPDGSPTLPAESVEDAASRA
jgi:class 3 adenylate cyclase/tetratricopeptide (TPR) repeat protein